MLVELFKLLLNTLSLTVTEISKVIAGISTAMELVDVFKSYVEEKLVCDKFTDDDG